MIFDDGLMRIKSRLLVRFLRESVERTLQLKVKQKVKFWINSRYFQREREKPRKWLWNIGKQKQKWKWKWLKRLSCQKLWRWSDKWSIPIDYSCASRSGPSQIEQSTTNWWCHSRICECLSCKCDPEREDVAWFDKEGYKRSNSGLQLVDQKKINRFFRFKSKPSSIKIQGSPRCRFYTELRTRVFRQDVCTWTDHGN